MCKFEYEITTLPNVDFILRFNNVDPARRVLCAVDLLLGVLPDADDADDLLGLDSRRLMRLMAMFR
jgi:hypothetical protein